MVGGARSVSYSRTSRKGGCSLAVSDDGTGMPPELDLEQPLTLGLQLVTLLAEQLGADLVVERKQPTSFALSFAIR